MVYLAPVALRFKRLNYFEPLKKNTQMSLEHRQTFLHHIPASIYREFPVDFDDNLGRERLSTRRFSYQNKKLSLSFTVAPVNGRS